MTGSERSETYVRYEASRGFAKLTLDSPHNRNALSARMLDELHRGLDAAASDPGGSRGRSHPHGRNILCRSRSR